MQKFAFCLSGFGDVTSVERAPKGTLVKIRVLSKCLDDIELECLVDKPDLIDRLDDLRESCAEKEYMLLHFSAHYLQFRYCHAGMKKRDPRQMVQLKGKLMDFEGWLRSSELPPAISPRDI